MRSHTHLAAWPVRLCSKATAACATFSVMRELDLIVAFIGSSFDGGANNADRGQKKADVAEHPEVFNHVGLLVNEPPGKNGVLFI
jgi:hypothetical protein